nr:MAG TPA: hypothetical protein [Caudoviricetes sp.]
MSGVALPQQVADEGLSRETNPDPKTQHQDT